MDSGKMNKLINKLADSPFEYGKNDCYTFTAKLVKEWHGVDYGKLHASYKSETDANEYIEANGGLERLTTGTLGYAIDPEKCRDGDVAIFTVGGVDLLGFVYDGYALIKTKRTVKRVHLSKCRIGWRLS